MTLTGRSAVVTGGGRGIGAAIAGALAEAGAAVVLASRTREEVEAVAGSLREEGHMVRAIPADVTDPGSVAELAATAGEVDILVNNAGIALSNPVHRTSLAEWNRALAVNATGTFLCTRSFLPGMLERGWGRCGQRRLGGGAGRSPLHNRLFRLPSTPPWDSPGRSPPRWP